LQVLGVGQHRWCGPRLSVGQISDQPIGSLGGGSFTVRQHADLQTIAVNALHVGQGLRTQSRLRPCRLIQRGLQIGWTHHAPVQHMGQVKVLDEICVT
jgi:hypothetical protein